MASFEKENDVLEFVFKTQSAMAFRGFATELKEKSSNSIDVVGMAPERHLEENQENRVVQVSVRIVFHKDIELGKLVSLKELLNKKANELGGQEPGSGVKDTIKTGPKPSSPSFAARENLPQDSGKASAASI